MWLFSKVSSMRLHHLAVLCGLTAADGFVVHSVKPGVAFPSQQHHCASAHTVASRRLHVAEHTDSWRQGPPPLMKGSAEGSGPEHDEKVAKALKAMVGFSNSYCKNTRTTYCSDPSIPAVVIKGLAEHKVLLGAPLCPCRHYEDKVAEAKDGYWNCPCVPMRERHECHCM